MKKTKETNPTLQSIFYTENGEQKEVREIIAALKAKSVSVPEWNEIAKSYDPMQHEILTNPARRPKDKKKGSVLEKYARVVYPAEKNTVRRMTQMMFTLPVSRKYKCEDEEIRKRVSAVIEAVYDKARIDGENVNRFKAYFAACEMVTIWYAVKQENDDYGFHSNVKLKCRSFSPMPTKYSKIAQAKIYPLFDANGDYVALSLEYDIIINGVKYTKFETFTDSMHYRWINGLEDSSFKEDIEPEEIITGKNPTIYIHRPAPIFEGIQNNRDEIEFTLSRTSDIIRKNSSPIMKLKGKLVDVPDNNPRKDVAREVYQFEGADGDIELVSPSITPENASFYIGQLQKNIEEDTQLPNLSLENTKALGAMTGEARKTLLTDAHMRCGEEKHEILEFLDRECHVIKALLAKANLKMEKDFKQVRVDHFINPFVMSDEDAKVKKAATAASGTRFTSQRTLIEMAGVVDDVDAEMERIRQEEEDSAAKSPLNSLFDKTE